MVDFAIEGLVHMRNLKDDYYEYDESTYSLVGKRKKRKLQIGQRLKVKVHEVDMTRRTIIEKEKKSGDFKTIILWQSDKLSSNVFNGSLHFSLSCLLVLFFISQSRRRCSGCWD
jgi:hypothetical protein